MDSAANLGANLQGKDVACPSGVHAVVVGIVGALGGAAGTLCARGP